MMNNGIRITSNGSEVGNEFVAGYRDLQAKYEQRKKELIQELRAKGVAAALYNDGWVQRDTSGNALSVVIGFALYAPATLAVGDTVALVSHYDNSATLWRVTGYKDNQWAMAISERDGLTARRYFLEAQGGIVNGRAK